MNTVSRFLIEDEAVYISDRLNTLGKYMKKTILPPAMDKYLGRLGALTTIQEKIKHRI